MKGAVIVSTKQRWEWRFGLLTAIWGIFVMVAVLFLPIYQCASSTGKPCGGGLLQMGIQPITIVVFAILLLDVVGIATFAYLDSRERGSWQGVLWGLTALLFVISLLSIASIGLFLLIAVILAITTSVLAGQNRQARMSAI